MFELGPEKLLMLGLIVLVLFGGRRIPEIGSGLGKGIREFKRSLAGMDEEPVSKVRESVPPGAAAQNEQASEEVAMVPLREEPKRLLS